MLLPVLRSDPEHSSERKSEMRNPKSEIQNPKSKIQNLKTQNRNPEMVFRQRKTPPGGGACV